MTAAGAVIGGAPITVPYITQWSAEDFSPVAVVHRRRGIAYANERPGDRNGDGLLWLVGEDPDSPETWPDPLLIADLPVCSPCAAKAVRLRRQHTALCVSAFELTGVSGFLYVPGIARPVAAAGVGYDDPRVRWVRAGQLIVRLRDFTITDLDTETRNTASSQKREP